MGTLSQFENNSLRKSYRTSVPLFVIIENQYYSVIDWSLNGLAIENFPKKLSLDQVVDSKLLIQLEEATISIPVSLRLVYSKDNRSGFEFQRISEKNKKVLKRFIEHAIEGKLTQTNNLISIYEEPEIKTPINAPIKLEAQEYKELNRAFHVQFLKYLLFALLVLATLGFLFFSQLRYSYKGSGTVVGNYQKIYPKVQATIENIYFKEGDSVKKGDILAQFDTQDIRYKITLLQTEKKQFIENKKHLLANEELMFNKAGNKEIQRSLTQQMRELKKMYQNAKVQYNNHLITSLEYSKIKSKYLDSKLKLQQNRVKNLQFKKRLEHNFDTNSAENFDIKIAHTKELLKDYNLFSPVSGKVYEIYGIPGEIAQINRPLLTIWTKDRPLIEVNIPQSKISKIDADTKVDVIDPIKHQTYTATVVKIGSLDDDKYTKVVLKPMGDTSQLKPNQRLDVLFRRTFKNVF